MTIVGALAAKTNLKLVAIASVLAVSGFHLGRSFVFSSHSPSKYGSVQFTSATARPAQQRWAKAPVWGFADTHTHQFANLAFGGTLFHGAAYGPEAEALKDCGLWHGLTFGVPSHPRSGFASFAGWPRWNTQVHQQMYSDWLYRAFQGGLRLMVMLAVNNEMLCQAARAKRSTPCADSAVIAQQLRAARAMEEYVRESQGGWYHIVLSPEEARETIAAGRMAVVLGVEADRPFACSEAGGCTAVDVDRELERYYKLGVRHFFPLHLADNEFGGMAVYGSRVNWNYLNRFVNGKWLDIETCSDRDITYNINRGSAGSFLTNLVTVTHGIGVLGSAPHYSNPPGHCNARGLTCKGRSLIEALMRKHMIIDIDHMSKRSADETLSITRTYHYPVIAGHTSFLGAAKGERASEYLKSDEQLREIAAEGGMVSAGLAEVGRSDEVRPFYGPSAPPNDCSNSSKTWAQAYLYAVDRLGGPDRAAIGMATDQSFVNLVAPRFGPEACAGGGKHEREIQRPDSRVKYPIKVLFSPEALVLPKSSQGSRTFDFNTDGMAHVGMYPDFINDLQNIGLSERQLAPLFRSAEKYIEMWEQIEAAGNHEPKPAR